MGAVPGFCGANRQISMARKLLGQPPMVLGTVEFTAILVELASFGDIST